jgi:hypothetical protein
MAVRVLNRVLFLFLLACSANALAAPPSETFKKTGHNSLYVVSTDFITGGVYRVDLATGRVSSAVLPVAPDATARWDKENNQLVVLNRSTGNTNLTVAPADLSKITTQIPLPAKSNPQDVFFLGNREVYVSFLKEKYIGRFHLGSGKKIAEVALTALEDEDGFAEATYFQRVGDQLVVALQRLNSAIYQPSGKSYLGLLDTKKNILKTAPIELEEPNPFTELKVKDGFLYVGEMEFIDRDVPILMGGIERFDALTLKSQKMVISEKELGGDIQDFEILTPTQGVAIVGTPDTEVVLFDPSTGKKNQVLLAREGIRFAHVMADYERQVFFVADRNASSPSIRIFDFNGVEKAALQISLKLPPFRMLLAP